MWLFSFFCVVSKNVKIKLWCPLEFMFTTLDTLWERPFFRSDFHGMGQTKGQQQPGNAIPRSYGKPCYWPTCGLILLHFQRFQHHHVGICWSKFRARFQTTNRNDSSWETTMEMCKKPSFWGPHFLCIKKFGGRKPSAFQLPFSLDIMTSPSETELTDVANFVKKQKQQSMEFPGSLNRW